MEIARRLAKLESQMENQPRAVVDQSKPDARRNYNMTIWAKSWAVIIEKMHRQAEVRSGPPQLQRQPSSGIA